MYDDVLDGNSTDAYSSYADEDIGPDGIVVVWKIPALLQRSLYKFGKTHLNIETPRNSQTNRLGLALIYCLKSKMKGTLIPLQLVGSFFKFIPARLGRNAALDVSTSWVFLYSLVNP